jgi:hypothetical protein
MQGRIIAVLPGAPWGWADLRILMCSCKKADMRTSIDFPDALFKLLKTRATQEGRTLRDLVIELVDPRKRFHARLPVIPKQGLMALR